MSNSKHLFQKEEYPYKWVPGGKKGGPPVRDMADAKSIREDLETWGWFHAHGEVLSEKKCRAEIHAIYKEQILKLGWSEKFTMKVYDTDGSVLDIDNPAHYDAYVAAVTRPLTAKELEHALACAPPGKTFGRPCCPGATMTPLQVDLRNCLEFNKLMRTAMGLEDDDAVQVFAGIEGYILRFPTMGQMVRPHLDMSANHWAAQCFAGDTSCDVIQMKYNIGGPCTFSAVVGSHSFPFCEEFVEKCGDEYDMTCEKPMFHFCPDKADPMGIFDNISVFEIGSGEVVGWDPRLIHVHSTVPRKSATVYGGIMNAIKATKERAEAYLEKAGIPEWLDRYLTWLLSELGRLHPSLKDCGYRMPMAINFPQIEVDLTAKLPEGSDRIRHYTQDNGRARVELLPPDTSHYVPKPLTPQGIEDLLCYSQEPGALEARVEIAMVQAAVVAAAAAGTPTKWKDFLTTPLKWNREDLPPRPTRQSRRKAARAAAAAEQALKPAPKRQRKAAQKAPLSEVMQGKQAADVDEAEIAKAADADVSEEADQAEIAKAPDADVPDDADVCEDDEVVTAKAGPKRKRKSALESSDEEEELEGPSAKGPSQGGAAVADDSDDDVIFVPPPSVAVARVAPPAPIFIDLCDSD